LFDKTTKKKVPKLIESMMNSHEIILIKEIGGTAFKRNCRFKGWFFILMKQNINKEGRAI